MLEPVLKNSQVNMLNLQGEVVVIVYVNGAVLIVQVVIVLDPTYGPSQGCEPMGSQACSFTILLGFLEILHDPSDVLRGLQIGIGCRLFFGTLRKKLKANLN